MRKDPFEMSGEMRRLAVMRQKKVIASIYRAAYLSVKKIPKKVYLVASTDAAKKDKGRKFALVALKELERVSGDIESIVRESSEDVAGRVADDNAALLYDLGFMDDFVSRFHDKEKVKEIVDKVLSGSLYDSKKSFRNIMDDDFHSMKKELFALVEASVKKGDTMDEILSEVESYFNPKKKPLFGWGPGVHGVRKVPDYVVMAAAGTSVSHSYEEMLVELTKGNPFIQAYRWVTSGTDRVCPVCIDREQTDRFGLGPGVFPKNELPLDHPNGMCTFEMVFSDDISSANRHVMDWYRGAGSKKEEIDEWLNDF